MKLYSFGRGGWRRILTELGPSPEGGNLPKLIYCFSPLRAGLKNRPTSSTPVGLEECLWTVLCGSAKATAHFCPVCVLKCDFRKEEVWAWLPLSPSNRAEIVPNSRGFGTLLRETKCYSRCGVPVRRLCVLGSAVALGSALFSSEQQWISVLISNIKISSRHCTSRVCLHSKADIAMVLVTRASCLRALAPGQGGQADGASPQEHELLLPGDGFQELLSLEVFRKLWAPTEPWPSDWLKWGHS